MGTLVRGGKVLMQSGKVPHIGDNGHWFVGTTDLGIKASGSVNYVDQKEFDTSYKEGIYFVNSNNHVNTWKIDSLGVKSLISSGEYNAPVIGSNGNWFVNGEDTGVSSMGLSNVSTITVFAKDWLQNATTGTYYNVVSVGSMSDQAVLNYNFYAAPETTATNVTSAKTAYNLITNAIPGSGIVTFYAVTVPTTDFMVTINNVASAVSDSTTLIGAVLDDESVNVTTGWSSHKIRTELDLINEIKDGKSVDFIWDDTKLGIRQSGESEYVYRDLKGIQGDTGIDGSSIVDASVDPNTGHLILTMQDPDDNTPTDRVLSLEETGMITKATVLSMQNSINLLHKQIDAFKASPIYVVKACTSTTSKYTEVLNKTNGYGTCQIIVTPYSGNLRITIDGVAYTLTANGLSQSIVADGVYVLTIDDTDGSYVPTQLTSIIDGFDSCSVVSFDDTAKSLVMAPLFGNSFASSVPISYKSSIRIETTITSNKLNKLPTFLIQGNHYSIPTE